MSERGNEDPGYTGVPQPLDSLLCDPFIVPDDYFFPLDGWDYFVQDGKLFVNRKRHLRRPS